MRYQKVTFTLLLCIFFLFLTGNTVFADELWKLDKVDSNHTFTITFNKEIDTRSLNNIQVLDEEDSAVPVVVSSVNPKEAIIDAPANGYQPGKVYYIHVSSGVKTLKGENLKKPIIAKFAVNGTYDKEVSGEFIYFGPESKSIFLKQANGDISELNLEEDADFFEQFGQKKNSVTQNYFSDLLLDLEKAYVTYEIENGKRIYTVTPQTFTGTFDGFVGSATSINGISLFIKDTNMGLNFPITADTNYYNQQHNQPLHLSKEDFIDVLNSAVKAHVKFELKDGTPNYIVTLDVFKGKFEGVSSDYNEVSLLIGNTDKLIDFPLLTNAEYDIHETDGKQKVSKEEFISQITASEKAYITYEKINGMIHYVADIESSKPTNVSGELDRINPNSQSIFLKQANGESTELLLDEKATYYEQIGKNKIPVSKDYFIEILGTLEKSNVSFELVDDKPIYTMTATKYTGIFDGFIGSSNTIDSIALLVPEEDGSIEFPITEETHYFVQLGENISLPQEDFIELLNVADRAQVSFELKNGVPYYTVKIDSFTGNYDGMLADGTEIYVYIGDTDKTITFPINEEAHYYYLKDEEKSEVTLEEFSDLLKDANQNTIITYQIENGKITYTVSGITIAPSPPENNKDELTAEIEAALLDRKKEFTIEFSGDTSELSAKIERAFDTILLENEYLSYDYKGHGYSLEKTSNHATIQFKANYYQSAEQVAYVNNKIPQILDTIINDTMNDHERVKAVHDYIVLNVQYDTSMNQGVNAPYFALTEGKTLCNGYAMLMYQLLKELNIPVRLISGTAGSQNHAWNLVGLDGKWYHLDATWNDPIPDEHGRLLYSYYLLSDDVMKVDHHWSEGGLNHHEEPYPVANTDYADTLSNLGYDELAEGLGIQYMSPKMTVATDEEFINLVKEYFNSKEDEFSLRYVTSNTNLKAKLSDLTQKAVQNTGAHRLGYNWMEYKRTVEKDYIITFTDINYVSEVS